VLIRAWKPPRRLKMTRAVTSEARRRFARHLRAARCVSARARQYGISIA
jgi:hypothetical protein